MKNLPDISQTSAECIAELIAASADKQTAVGSAIDGNVITGRITVLGEPFSSIVEIIKDILLFQLHAGFVPGVAVLSAATNVSHSIDTVEVLDKEHAEYIIARLDVDVETTISVKHCWILAVLHDILTMNQEHWHESAIFALVLDLSSLELISVQSLNGGFSEYLLKNRRRGKLITGD